MSFSGEILDCGSTWLATCALRRLATCRLRGSSSQGKTCRRGSKGLRAEDSLWLLHSAHSAQRVAVRDQSGQMYPPRDVAKKRNPRKTAAALIWPLVVASAFACALCLETRQLAPCLSRPSGHGTIVLRSGSCLSPRRIPAFLRLRGGSGTAAVDQLDRAPAHGQGSAMPSTVEHCDTSVDPAAGWGVLGREGMEGQVRLRMAALKDVVEMQHINLVTRPGDNMRANGTSQKWTPPKNAT